MEHLINLNFAPGGLPATVHVSQYDDTIRQLRFQLWFGRSKVEVPSGASVRVDIKKPDGHIVLVTGTVDSSDRSIVTVPTTKQMTAVPGGARGTLVVSSTGDKRISSAIFILQVHRDPVEDGDASDSDLSMLQDAIDQTAANATAAQAAATAAQQAASSFTTDTTLSVSGKAADAKKTGDEISAIKADLDTLSSQVGVFTWTAGQYIPTDVDPVNVSNIQANTTWKCMLVEVTPGEQYTLAHVSSGNAARAWCITDASGNVLDVADSMTDYAEQVITIPELGAYLIVHAYASTENANVTGATIKTRVDKLEADLDNIDESLGEQAGRITNLETTQSDIEEEIQEAKDLISQSGIVYPIPYDFYTAVTNLLVKVYYREKPEELEVLKRSSSLYVYDSGIYLSQFYDISAVQSCRTILT